MKSKSLNNIIIAVLINVVLIGVWVWLYYGVNQAKDSFDQLEKELAAEEVTETYLRTTKITLRENEISHSSLSEHFIFEDQEIVLLEKIEEMALEAGVSIDIRNFAKEDTEKVLRIVAETQGTFSQVYHFMRLIEHLPYKIWLEEATFAELGDGENATGIWEGRFDIRLGSYILK